MQQLSKRDCFSSKKFTEFHSTCSVAVPSVSVRNSLSFAINRFKSHKKLKNTDKNYIENREWMNLLC